MRGFTVSVRSADHRAKLGREGRTKETKAAGCSHRVCGIIRVAALGLFWAGFLGKQSLRWRLKCKWFPRGPLENSRERMRGAGWGRRSSEATARIAGIVLDVPTEA